jgi:general secretion pathway protein L
MRIDTGNLSLFGIDLGRAWRWWLSGMEQILPAGWPRIFLKSTSYLVAELGDRGLRLSLSSGESITALLELEAESLAVTSREALLSFLPQGKRTDRPELLLCLQTSSVLRRSISVPMAAQSSLHDAVRYQLARLTPFPTDAVYFDVHPRGADRQAGMLEVDVLVAPRAVVDPLIEQLVSLLGLPVMRAGVLEADGRLAPFNLLQGHVKGGKWWRRLNLNAYLSIALIVALALACVAPVAKQRELVVERKKELLELNARAADLLEKKHALDEQLSLISFIVAQRQKAPSASEAIAELTDLIPSSAYLSSFLIKDGNIELAGSGTGIVDLIDLLNASPMFEGARFAAPLSRDPRTGKDQFRITLRFKKADGGETP